MRRISNDTKGAIMLEGLLVFIIMTFLLMLLIAMFGLLYQRWNMQTVANDAAAKLAQTYQYSETGSQADIYTGYIEKVNAVKVRPYRHMINKTAFENDAKQRIANFAEQRLQKSMLIIRGSSIDVKTEIKSDYLARRHVEVTIASSFIVPYQNVFNYMGFGNAISYQVTGYADCVDLLDYLNTVEFVNHATDPNRWFKSDTTKAINSLLSLIDKFIS